MFTPIFQYARFYKYIHLSCSSVYRYLIIVTIICVLSLHCTVIIIEMIGRSCLMAKNAYCSWKRRIFLMEYNPTFRFPRPSSRWQLSYCYIMSAGLYKLLIHDVRLYTYSIYTHVGGVNSVCAYIIFIFVFVLYNSSTKTFLMYAVLLILMHIDIAARVNDTL